MSRPDEGPREGPNGGPTEGSWSRLGRPGGDWQGVRPTFDNPLSWSVRLLAVAGITVRVHVVFLIFILIVLLQSAAPPPATSGEPGLSHLDFGVMLPCMLALVTIVLAHELGHCLACRWSGGEAREILMWPLGGLAFCRPPRRWTAHLATAAGGPAVNVLFCVVAGGLLGLQTGHWLGVALPNPLRLYRTLMEYDLTAPLPTTLLFLVNWCSLTVLLLNLLPVFPLDGGRIVQALLWSRFGYARSMRLTVQVGYLGAVALAIAGAIMQHWILVAVAAFGGVTCFITHKQLEFTEGIMTEPDGAGDDESLAEEPPPSPELEHARRRAETEAAEDEQVEAILAKISEEGMDSLSTRERRLLRRVTARRREH